MEEEGKFQRYRFGEKEENKGINRGEESKEKRELVWRKRKRKIERMSREGKNTGMVSINYWVLSFSWVSLGFFMHARIPF